VRQYLSDRPTLRLAVLLMDSRREPQKSDLNMLKYFRAANVPMLVLATKVDKLKLEEIEPNLARLHQYFRLPEGMPVPFSSVTGLNRRAVWGAIRDACVGEYVEMESGGGGGGSA
jgi:GTP-binding protein